MVKTGWSLENNGPVKKKKKSAKIQKALLLSADLLCPWRSFTYLPQAGLARMTATKLIALGDNVTNMKSFRNRTQILFTFKQGVAIVQLRFVNLYWVLTRKQQGNRVKASPSSYNFPELWRVILPSLQALTCWSRFGSSRRQEAAKHKQYRSLRPGVWAQWQLYKTGPSKVIHC